MKFLTTAFIGLMVFALYLPVRATSIALIPLPGLVAQSDLIVQVKLVKAGDPAKKEVVLPELNFGGRPPAPKPETVLVRLDKVKIEKIYRDTTGKLKEGDEIDVTVRARPPEPPQPAGGPVRMVTGGGMFYPELAAGQSYVLLLRSMGEGKGYYIPAYFRCVTKADAVNASFEPNATELLDVEKWNWGKADESGLQIGIPMVDARPNLQAPQVFVAARNKSDKPITLTLDSDLKPLSFKVTASAPDEKAVPLPDVYIQVKSDPRTKQPVELKPGQVVIITAYGAGPFATPLSGSLMPGHYKAIVAYTVDTGKLPKPSAPSAEKNDTPPVKYWTGKVESAPVLFDVIKAPTPLPPGGRGAP